MEAKLTPQQREAILAHQGQPVAVIDDASNERFYLIAEPALRHLQELASDNAAQRREHLRQLIQEGIDSPGVPVDEAFARLDDTAKRLAGQTP